MKKNDRRFALFFIILGIMVLLADSIFLVRRIIINCRTEEVTAIVEEVPAVRRRYKRRFSERTIYVRYEYEGVKYYHVELKVREIYSVDTQIPVYVDSKNPTSIYDSKTPVNEIGFGVVAAVITIMGVLLLHKEKQKIAV